jgi:hypothetical protein
MQYHDIHHYHYVHSAGEYIALPRRNTNGSTVNSARALDDMLRVCLQNVRISICAFDEDGSQVIESNGAGPLDHRLLNTYELALLLRLCRCWIQLHGFPVTHAVQCDVLSSDFIRRVMNCDTWKRYLCLRPTAQHYLLDLFTKTATLLAPCLRNTVITRTRTIRAGDDAVHTCETVLLEPMEPPGTTFVALHIDSYEEHLEYPTIDTPAAFEFVHV